jgi:hypothetical protein
MGSTWAVLPHTVPHSHAEKAWDLTMHSEDRAIWGWGHGGVRGSGTARQGVIGSEEADPEVDFLGLRVELGNESVTILTP